MSVGCTTETRATARQPRLSETHYGADHSNGQYGVQSTDVDPQEGFGEAELSVQGSSTEGNGTARGIDQLDKELKEGIAETGTEQAPGERRVTPHFQARKDVAQRRHDRRTNLTRQNDCH